MDKILILLSTYNGEQYLKEQLDSLIAQEGVEWTLLIRDDGSKDGTLRIIEEYAERDNRIKYYQGKNIGASNSFFDLIKNAGVSDYYAFCDQDDQWMPDKLKRGIDFIKNHNSNIPLLYYSNLRIVDENMKFYRLSHKKPHIQDNKYCGLVGNMASGCSMVLNKTAMDLIKSHLPKSCNMHDWWVFLVCGFFGEQIYDIESRINYRQHSDNVAGTYLDRITIRFIINRFRSVFKPKEQPRYHMALNLMECFGKQLNKEDYLKVEKFTKYRDSIGNTIKLLCDKDIHAATVKREVAYRISVLLRIA